MSFSILSIFTEKIDTILKSRYYQRDFSFSIIKEEAVKEDNGMKYDFIDGDGTFILEQPEKVSGLYLPLVNQAGVMGSITPTGHGDSKLAQEQFLLEPASAENLHSQAPSRNFWCCVEGKQPWSIFGQSAIQEAKRYTEKADKSKITVGPFWQKTERFSEENGISAEVVSFCPAENKKAEIMIIKIRNQGIEAFLFQPVAAVELYGRSADNLRDHRHVTSLLNQVEVTEDGIVLKPCMSFDERGHHRNTMTYSVLAQGENGEKHCGAIPFTREFIGEGGSLLWPRILAEQEKETEQLWRKAGYCGGGYECIGALRFRKIQLNPGEVCRFTLVLSYGGEGTEYLNIDYAEAAFRKMKTFWQEERIMGCVTGNAGFDQMMQWIALQPELRRIFGCSFLPHHDYGRGGRGWRDLWQDCLALLLKDPDKVRSQMVLFFAGVRPDGSNATIIGKKQGEFKADRNSIPRIWMDHAYWPYRTMQLYLDVTGDIEILFEETAYFNDGMTRNKTKQPEAIILRQNRESELSDDRRVRGSILEHMLLQQLTQFYDVGEHNHMRLRGADWNDALDMARERGESVAFTAAYSGSMKEMAVLLRFLKEKKHIDSIEIAQEIIPLLMAEKELYYNIQEKQELLKKYCMKTAEGFCGKKVKIQTGLLVKILERMGEWIQNHIRLKEMVTDERGNYWFNGYYDEHGRQVEGKKDETIRMMLTSQVFSILSGTAADEQIEKIVRAADQYLYDEKAGGYRLNTDFGELKLDLGRMFGFVYGHKENGAVFCHMAVMYAYALYQRHFTKEGYKVLFALYRQAADFKTSCIYPGIPEYFNAAGRGMYPYLTGAGSWFVLTMITQVYGVRGSWGNLYLAPQLLAEQFNEVGDAKLDFHFAGRRLWLIYKNKKHLDVGDYEISEIYLNEQSVSFQQNCPQISREMLLRLDTKNVHTLTVVLN